MADTSLFFTPAAELAALIRARKLSPVELVTAVLERIRELNPWLHAYLAVDEAEAVAAARTAERAVAEGRELPLLHGVPVAIKDLDYTRGLRTTGGSLVFRDFVPDEDGAAVERLRRAGAIIVGKTNTPEFGSYSEVWNRLGDDTCTPWDRSRTAGGSSGGSAAAVATGMAPWATGTDGAGSIRIPSSFCGVYGLKPTFGLVSNYGGFLALPQFSVVGPITRTVRDAALMLTVIAGHDRRDPHSRRERPPDFLAALGRPLGGLRMAWSPDLGFADVTAEVRALAGAAARAFESLGGIVEEATPAIPEDFFTAAEPVRNTDKYAAYGHLLEDKETADQLTPYIRAMFERARRITAMEYSRSLRSIERLRAQVVDFFERYDVLLTPTTAFPAFALRQPPVQKVAREEVATYASAVLLTVLANLTGQPAASVPCGFSADGLPVGLQIIGRPGEDATILQVSAAFEQARPWAGKRPPEPALAAGR